MHLFECEATLEACPAAVWAVWTDVARWPEWDVGKEIARLDGPFEPGVSGWAKQRGNLGGTFTITAVEAERRWVSECPVPLGKVVFDHLLEPVTKDRVRVVKRIDVEGGITPLVLLFAPKMRRDICESLAALGRLAATTPLAGLSADDRAAARRHHARAVIIPRRGQATGRWTGPAHRPGRARGPAGRAQASELSRSARDGPGISKGSRPAAAFARCSLNPGLAMMSPGSASIEMISMKARNTSASYSMATCRSAHPGVSPPSKPGRAAAGAPAMDASICALRARSS
jgi:hypothetical protein